MTVQFKMPSIFIKTGLKLITQGQIDFMVRLFNRDAALLPIIQHDCHPQLSWRVRGGNVTAAFHVGDPFLSNRHIIYSYSDNVPRDFKVECDTKFNTIESFVEFVETTYQINEHLSMWASDNEEDLGYEPELDREEDENSFDYLVPLTLERINRLDQPNRRMQLERVIGSGYGYKYHFKNRFYLSETQAQQIWYGETGFKLDVMLNAQKGDESAIKLWDAIN